METSNSDWEVFYSGCYNEDGTLFFPERLTENFLQSARKHMGSQYFANQYLNKVMDDKNKPFKPEWLQYYEDLPRQLYTFAMIDPAISQSDSADFTALIVVQVDINRNWYVKAARKYKITPPELINLLFEVHEQFSPMIIGIESVAFQKALVYMAQDEMQRRGIMLPLQEVKPPTDKTKEMKIMTALVPRFEWGRIFLARRLFDFEQEYLDYAGVRSKHDDMLDALASIEELLTYPTLAPEVIPNVPSNHPDYEKYYRARLAAGKRSGPAY